MRTSAVKSSAKPTPKPFDLWVRLYAVALGTDSKVLYEKLSSQHIQHFNMRMCNIKASFDWDSVQIKGLVVFCFTHNPLNVDITQYGNINALCEAARFYNEWCRQHPGVKSHLLLRTIIDDGKETLQAHKLEQVYRV